MTKVTMYRCKYCDKDFRTKSRHDCKFDPYKKNCFSCKHKKGQKEERIPVHFVAEYECEETKNYFICKHKENEELGPYVEDLIIDNYILNCPFYETGEYEK